MKKISILLLVFLSGCSNPIQEYKKGIAIATEYGWWQGRNYESSGNEKYSSENTINKMKEIYKIDQ